MKESIFVLKGGKYVESKPIDLEILQKFEIDTEKFKKKLEVLYEDGDWAKFRKTLKCVRVFQLLVGFLALFYIGIFTALMFTNFTPGKLDPYEMLYLGFCGTLLSFFLMIAFMVYIEAKVFQKTRPKILKKLQDTLQEEFMEVSFHTNIDKCLTLRIRPMVPGDGDLSGMDLEKMDYYDYLDYNNPEEDDYYSKQNPYELDPHEKNVMAEMVSQREKKLEKEQKKGKKFKFLGAGK